MRETPLTELKEFVAAQIEVHEALGNHHSRDARKAQLAALSDLETRLRNREAELAKAYACIRALRSAGQQMATCRTTPIRETGE